MLRCSARGAFVIGCIALPLVFVGCNRATVLNPSPNDALRAENQQLRERVDRLSLQVKELETRQASRRMSEAGASSRTLGAASQDPVIEAAIPRIASVQIEGATEVVRGAGGTSAPATLRLWVLPKDGQGRFLQVVGTLRVGVAILRAGEKPLEVAQASFGPTAVREAWRSGFMGSHYAFETILTVPPEHATTPLTISIRFDDALSGRAFEDERQIAAPRDGSATLSNDTP